MAERFRIRTQERHRISTNAYAFEPQAVPVQSGQQPLGLLQPQQQQQRPRRPSRLGTDNWCKCGNCRPMPKEKECICCHEGEELREKKTGVDCIVRNESFKKICLDKEVLEVVFASKKEHLGESVHEDELVNRNYRHISYRCFVWWVFNRLKKRDRRVIPSCAVWAIREKFPEVNGEYTGFVDAVGDNEIDFIFE